MWPESLLSDMLNEMHPTAARLFQQHAGKYEARAHVLGQQRRAQPSRDDRQ
jgi:hypothetical protein